MLRDTSVAVMLAIVLCAAPSVGPEPGPGARRFSELAPARPKGTVTAAFLTVGGGTAAGYRL